MIFWFGLLKFNSRYSLETATPKVPAEKDQSNNKTDKKKKKGDKTIADSGAQIVSA